MIEIQEINGKKFVLAHAISKGNIYRFDLSSTSTTTLCKSHDFGVWTFGDADNDANDFKISSDEIRSLLGSNRIWRKI